MQVCVGKKGGVLRSEPSLTSPVVCTVALGEEVRCLGETVSVEGKERVHVEAAGGSGWDTIRWKQDLLERTCIAMAIANFRLLDAHTRAS